MQIPMTPMIITMFALQMMHLILVEAVDEDLHLILIDHHYHFLDLEVVDSLDLARNKHPGQKNNLDALCKRYNVDNSQRELHGALLDAEILADVYLLLTGGQVTLGLGEESETSSAIGPAMKLDENSPGLKVIRATPEEMAAHEAKLDELDKSSEAGSLWRREGQP